LIGLWMIW